MNWEAMSAIGEVVGAVGVIVSLVYLALQIRQNSNVIRSATRQSISTTQVELGLRIGESAELRAAMGKLWDLGDRPTAAQDAEIRNLFLYRAFLRAYENQYHQYEDGTFDADMWIGYRENMRLVFSTPKGPPRWKKNPARRSSRCRARPCRFSTKSRWQRDERAC